VWSKVEAVAKTLEVNVLSYAPLIHPSLTDPTNTTVCICTRAARGDNVACQLCSVEVPLGILQHSRQLLLVLVPSNLQLLVRDFEDAGDGRTGSLFLAPLALEV
jgi:hypothetical protein